MPSDSIDLHRYGSAPPGEADEWRRRALDAEDAWEELWAAIREEELLENDPAICPTIEGDDLCFPERIMAVLEAHPKLTTSGKCPNCSHEWHGEDECSGPGWGGIVSPTNCGCRSSRRGSPE